MHHSTVRAWPARKRPRLLVSAAARCPHSAAARTASQSQTCPTLPRNPKSTCQLMQKQPGWHVELGSRRNAPPSPSGGALRPDLGTPGVRRPLGSTVRPRTLQPCLLALARPCRVGSGSRAAAGCARSRRGPEGRRGSGSRRGSGGYTTEAGRGRSMKCSERPVNGQWKVVNR